MAHSLPPQSHPAREMFDVADLVAVSTGKQPVPCAVFHARKIAARSFNAGNAVRRVAMFLVDATNDQLQLVSFGRRGAMRIEWTFGPITRETRLA